MLFLPRILLPTLLPLLVCGLIGACALAGLRSLLHEETTETRLGGVAFLAISVMFGSRLCTLLLQILGMVGIGFRLSLGILSVLGLAAGVRLVIRRRGTVLPPRRRQLTELELLAGAFFLTLLFCAGHSWIDGFDTFTHWLVVPREILSFDRMAYSYGTTRSVAPSYPLDQAVVSAAAILLSGGRDAILNLFPGIFLFLGALAILEAAFVLTRSRWLAGIALAITIVVSGNQEVVFGYAYGDGLVLSTMAFAMLGIAMLARYRSRASNVLVWACLSTPVMAKGFGAIFASFGVVLFLLLTITFVRRRRDVPHAYRYLFGLGALSAVEIVLPRLFLIGVESSTQPLATVRNPFGDSVGWLWRQVFAATSRTPTFVQLFLALAALVVLAVVRRRQVFRTSLRLALPMIATYGAMAWAGIVTFGLLMPESKISWPRYVSMIGPMLAMLTVLGIALLGRLRDLAALVVLTITCYGFFVSDYPGYLRHFAGRKPKELATLPRSFAEFDKHRDLLKQIKSVVDSVQGRVFFRFKNTDYRTPYQLSTMFAMAGIRAPLLTIIATTTAKNVEIARQFDLWLFEEGAKAPVPPSIHPPTDFLLLDVETQVRGHPLKGLWRLADILALPDVAR